MLRLLLLASLLLAGCSTDPPQPPSTTAPPDSSTTAPADTTTLDQYVGVEYPPMPEGVTKRGGALIVPPGTSASEAEYAFVKARRGEQHMLWLGRLQHRTPEGEAIFRVADIVAVPDVAEDERFLISGCTVGGDVGYAAVMADGDAEQLTQTHHAWRADRETGHLAPADDADVVCENVGFGI